MKIDIKSFLIEFKNLVSRELISVNYLIVIFKYIFFYKIICLYLLEL